MQIHCVHEVLAYVDQEECDLTQVLKKYSNLIIMRLS